jgi:hypothetical protein
MPSPNNARIAASAPTGATTTTTSPACSSVSGVGATSWL